MNRPFDPVHAHDLKLGRQLSHLQESNLGHPAPFRSHKAWLLTSWCGACGRHQQLLRLAKPTEQRSPPQPPNHFQRKLMELIDLRCSRVLGSFISTKHSRSSCSENTQASQNTVNFPSSLPSTIPKFKPHTFRSWSNHCWGLTALPRHPRLTQHRPRSSPCSYQSVAKCHCLIEPHDLEESHKAAGLEPVQVSATLAM